MAEKLPDNVRLSPDGDAVVILDQTRLPGKTVYLSLRDAESMFEAIYSLRVRGAPAIGIFAAYCMAVLSKTYSTSSFDAFYTNFHRDKGYLDSSRPTAVNLGKMLGRMENTLLQNSLAPLTELPEILKAEAEQIQQEDIAMCRAISEYGLQLVHDGDGILTHCNAGELATSRYGTGLGTLFLGRERGKNFHAYVDETRPLLQGARLTAFELHRAGIDCTLICDNMASLVMREGKISACFAGCDRVARNGDAANKIGTSSVAILARHYGIPFYIFCPSSTIDFKCRSGKEIPIEQRDPGEIKEKFFTEPIAPDGVRCYNPAFDVTDAALVTAIVTERGICRFPYEESFEKLFSEQIG